MPHLHIATAYDNLRIDKMSEIKTWILREGGVFHKRVREYLASFVKDINPSLASHRGGWGAAVGTFGLTELPKAGEASTVREVV